LSDCYTCSRYTDPESLPPRERIVASDLWRVVHSFNTSLPGWLVLIPNRHVEAIDELTEDEAAELGPLLWSLSRALRSVVGCGKTYVAQFAEAEGFKHVHFHIVPRMSWFVREQRGPRSLDAFLGKNEAERVPVEEMDRIALAIADELVKAQT
jgi:diadenosine tetraphosphate (Ap4A) HIT family hydrolase